MPFSNYFTLFFTLESEYMENAILNDFFSDFSLVLLDYGAVSFGICMDPIIDAKIAQMSYIFKELKAKLRRATFEDVVKVGQKWTNDSIKLFPETFQKDQERLEDIVKTSLKLLIEFLKNNSNKTFEKMVTDVFSQLQGIWNSLDKSAKQFVVLAISEFAKNDELEQIIDSFLGALFRG